MLETVVVLAGAIIPLEIYKALFQLLYLTHDPVALSLIRFSSLRASSYSRIAA